jgi:hypothetical protein
MATKAERFHYNQERSNQPKKGPARHGRKQVSGPDAGARNISQRAERMARVVTEESLSGKPSRKSTRSSQHRGKNSTMLERVSRMRSETPHRRHDKR